MRSLTYTKTRYCRVTPDRSRPWRCSTDLISKLVTGETQDHQPMGVLALKLVELAEVPGGGASERGHVLYEDHPSPEHVEVHRVAFQRGGLQVVESLGDERHFYSSVSTVEEDGGLGARQYPTAWSPDWLGTESCLPWVSSSSAGNWSTPDTQYSPQVSDRFMWVGVKPHEAVSFERFLRREVCYPVQNMGQHYCLLTQNSITGNYF